MAISKKQYNSKYAALIMIGSVLRIYRVLEVTAYGAQLILKILAIISCSEGEIHFSLLAMVSDRKLALEKRITELTTSSMDVDGKEEELHELRLQASWIYEYSLGG